MTTTAVSGGGLFYADVELPCGPLRFEVEAVTRQDITKRQPIRWDLWPTEGHWPLRWLIGFYTHTPWFVHQAKLKGLDRQAEAERTKPEAPFSGLRRWSIETGGFRVERDDKDPVGASVKYIVGPMQVALQFGAQTPGWLPKAMGVSNFAPGLSLGLDEVKASGHLGTYELRGKATASEDIAAQEWKVQLNRWTKVFDSKRIRMPAISIRPRLGVKFSSGMDGIAPVEQYTITGGSTVSKTPITLQNTLAAALSPKLEVPLPVHRLLPGPWIVPIEAAFMLNGGGPQVGIDAEVSLKWQANIPFRGIFRPSLLDFLKYLLDDDGPDPGSYVEIEPKGIAGVTAGLGSDDSVVRATIGLSGQYKRVYDRIVERIGSITSTHYDLKSEEVKGWVKAVIGAGWYEKTFRTNDYFLHSWKRGSESEISATSQPVTIDWVTQATNTAVAGTAVKGLSDRGNTVIALDSRGQLVMVRTLGGGTVAYPNNMQIQYLLMEPGASKWSDPKPVVTPSPGPALHVAATRMPDGRVLAVWSAYTKKLNRPFDSMLDFRNQQLFYAIWDSRKWSEPVQITRSDYANVLPALASDGAGSVLLAWVADRDGYPFTVDDTELQAARWTGSGFATGQVAVPGASVWQTPRLSVAGGNAAISYTRAPSLSPGVQTESPQTVVVVGSGNSWSAPQPAPRPAQANLPQGIQVSPVVVAEAGGARLYWVDTAPQPAQQDEDAVAQDAIYTAVLRDGVWSPATVVATEDSVNSLATLPPVNGAPAVTWSAPYNDGSALRAKVLAPGQETQVLDLAKAPARAGSLTVVPGAQPNDYFFLHRSPSGEGQSELGLARLPLAHQDLEKEMPHQGGQPPARQPGGREPTAVQIPTVTPTTAPGKVPDTVVTPQPSPAETPPPKGGGCSRRASGMSGTPAYGIWPALGMIMLGVIISRWKSGRRF